MAAAGTFVTVFVLAITKSISTLKGNHAYQTPYKSLYMKVSKKSQIRFCRQLFFFAVNCVREAFEAEHFVYHHPAEPCGWWWSSWQWHPAEEEEQKQKEEEE